MREETARKCKVCGRCLASYNPGQLCWACQEKKKELLEEQIGDTPHYTVDNLCVVLGFGNPESVRRLGRKGKIPGRIPGIRKHLYYRKTVNDWIRSEGKRFGSSTNLQQVREARDWLEHYGDLVYLVEELEKMFRQVTPKPTSITNPNAFNYDYLSNGTIIRKIRIEEDPLFGGLKQHIEKQELWQQLEEWKRLGGLYIQECLIFLEDIRHEAELKTRFKTGKSYSEDGLYETFWERIYEQAILEQQPSYSELDEYRLRNLKETEFKIKDNRLVVEYESIVAAQGEPSQLEQLPRIYEQLVSEFTACDKVEQIWQLWETIRNLESSIREILHSTKLKREFTGTCPLCPILGQPYSEIQTIRQIRKGIGRETLTLE